MTDFVPEDREAAQELVRSVGQAHRHKTLLILRDRPLRRAQNTSRRECTIYWRVAEWFIDHGLASTDDDGVVSITPLGRWVLAQREAPSCPHCGSDDVDRGATGLDLCTRCGGLSRAGAPLTKEDPMMVNLDNQRPGDLWMVGGERLEVVEARAGELLCRGPDGLVTLRVQVVEEGSAGAPGHRSLLDALLEDADEHEAAGRVIQAANARAAVENLRTMPPWAGDERGMRLLPDDPAAPLADRLLLALGIAPEHAVQVGDDAVVEAAVKIRAAAHRYPFVVEDFGQLKETLELLRGHACSHTCQGAGPHVEDVGRAAVDEIVDDL